MASNEDMRVIQDLKNCGLTTILLFEAFFEELILLLSKKKMIAKLIAICN